MDDIEDDAKRLDRLYREVGPQLLAYFRRRHRAPQLAEDLLQETFAAVMQRPGGLRQAGSPRAYLFGIARNLSTDAWREAHAAGNIPAEAPATSDLPAPDQRLEMMREAIMKLSPALREVLELRLQPELSYEEIASVLDIPTGTVRSRLHHAVGQLRQAMTRARKLENEKDHHES